MKKTLLSLFPITLSLLLSLPAAAQSNGSDWRHQMSRRMLQTINETYGPTYAVDSQSQIQTIFNRLLREAERHDVSYRVRLVSQDEINAYATPDGQIVMFTGLVEALNNSPDALAFVLAHELSHIEKHHAERQLTSSGLVGGVLDLLTRDRGQLGALLAQGAYGLVTSGYSRSMESEADHNAMDLMSRAHFDPRGALTTLRIFQQLEAQNPGLRIFPTHPAADDRYRDAVAWIEAHNLSGAGPLDTGFSSAESSQVQAINDRAQALWSDVRNLPIRPGDSVARLSLLHTCEALTRFGSAPNPNAARAALQDAINEGRHFEQTRYSLDLSPSHAAAAAQLSRDLDTLVAIYREQSAQISNDLAQELLNTVRSRMAVGRRVDPRASQALLELAESTYNYLLARRDGRVVILDAAGRSVTIGPEEALERVRLQAARFASRSDGLNLADDPRLLRLEQELVTLTQLDIDAAAAGR